MVVNCCHACLILYIFAQMVLAILSTLDNPLLHWLPYFIARDSSNARLSNEILPEHPVSKYFGDFIVYRALAYVL